MDIREFTNSINKIINERLTSPFYGALVIAWLLINWKIVYLTLFVDGDKLSKLKIDYIIENYSDYWHVLWLPLISTFLLLTIVPFITYGAFWANLFFTDLRQKKKIQVEKSQVLSVEQSLQIRSEIRNQKMQFNNLLDEKNSEIDTLRAQVNLLEKNIAENTSSNKPLSSLDEISDYRISDSKDLEREIRELINDEGFLKEFQYINESIQKHKVFNLNNSDFDYNTIAKLKAFDLIKEIGAVVHGKYYEFTEKGNKFLKFYYTKT